MEKRGECELTSLGEDVCFPWETMNFFQQFFHCMVPIYNSENRFQHSKKYEKPLFS